MKNRGGSDPYESYTSSTTTSSYASDARDECATVRFNDKLKNITSAFKAATVGEILTIKLERINVLMAFSETGEFYGNIASSFNGTIVQCMRREKEFGAEVLNLQGLVMVFSI